MAEPPAKRAKRTDSAAMWESHHKSPDPADRIREPRTNGLSKMKKDRGGGESHHQGHDGRKQRSRSRSKDRVRDRERRKDRSKSRDRAARRHTNGDRSRSPDRDGRRRQDGDRKRRDRSMSKERHRPTRDDPPARRPDRHRDRSRSRSPRRNEKPAVRTRSPPRGPSSRQPPSGPNKPTRSSRSPPPAKLPPTGPRKDNPSMPQINGAKPSAANAQPQPTDPGSKMDIDEDSDPETTMMRRMMGFASFKSTKNTKVPGNNVYAVRKEKKTEYRQYMNRVGGFNRPLSPSR